MTHGLHRTSLTPYAPAMRDPDPDGARKAAQRAWLDHGIVVLMPGDCSGQDRELVEAIAGQVYGRRASLQREGL